MREIVNEALSGPQHVTPPVGPQGLVTALVVEGARPGCLAALAEEVRNAAV